MVVDECGMSDVSRFDLLTYSMFTGAKFIYLPPYSPDFNPIERAFHSIKSWLRRHEAEATNEDVRPWLIHQAAADITPELADAYITNCGYE